MKDCGKSSKKRATTLDHMLATGNQAQSCSFFGAYSQDTRQRLVILSKSSSVFVVEDDASMRLSIKRLLREHGFNTTLFGSAEALLDHNGFNKAICIIIDINLNGQSGIELGRSLASDGVTAPVIYITGNDSQVNHLAAIESGCIAYLTKPFTAQSFIQAIERAQAAVIFHDRPVHSSMS